MRATLVLYEAGSRLGVTLAALAEGLGEREAAVAREISKAFEECVTGSLATLAARYAEAPPKGELVIVVAAPFEDTSPDEQDIDRLLADALRRLSPAQAAAEVTRQTGADRKTVYARALAMKR